MNETEKISFFKVVRSVISGTLKFGSLLVSSFSISREITNASSNHLMTTKLDSINTSTPKAEERIISNGNISEDSTVIELTGNKQIVSTPKKIDSKKHYSNKNLELEDQLQKLEQSKNEFFEVIQVKNDKSSVEVSPKLSKSTPLPTSSNGKSSSTSTSRVQADGFGFW